MILKYNELIYINQYINKNISLLDLFNINENHTREDVIDLIRNIEVVDNITFLKSLNKSNYVDQFTFYNNSDLSDIKLFKVKGLNIGYGLKKVGSDYDIVLVHNNEKNIKNIGSELMLSAISNGGTILDHYDIKVLNDLYDKLGFVEYNRISYDPKYDINNTFIRKYGTPDIVYRKLK